MTSPQDAWPFPVANAGYRAHAKERTVAASIVRIKLENLFGLYSYDIPSESMELDRTPILYGENGLGKTNILKILFHVLSCAPDRGHRTALAKIKFRRIEVFLSNEIQVNAVRTNEEMLGPVRLEVVGGSATAREILGAWDWYPPDHPSREAAHKWLNSLDPAAVRRINAAKRSPKDRSRAIQKFLFEVIEKESNPLESEDAFLAALRDNVPPIYFLTADRILMSDEVSKDALRYVNGDQPTRQMTAEIMVTKGRERALNEAIQMTSRNLSRLGVSATRQGSRSIHSIYQDLIARLAMQKNTEQPVALQSISALKQKLLDLTELYELYEKYGLAPRLNGIEIAELLDKMQPHSWSAATEVLTPYVESLTEQANSLRSAYQIIDTLVSTVNAFLYDKSLGFSLGEGMLVRNKLGELLEPSDLSSGEQQLLLLFCHITMAHDSGGIFIIDEPEISLNIKWQRRLVDALTRLDPSENLQFVLASHSMEVLTKHRQSVVSLEEARR